MIILTIGFINIINTSLREEIDFTEDKIVKVEEEKVSLKKLILEKKSIFDIEMLVFHTETDGLFKPLQSSCHISGFVNGFEWEDVVINFNQNNGIYSKEFQVTGNLKWKLFGIELYSQKKVYKSHFDESSI